MSWIANQGNPDIGHTARPADHHMPVGPSDRVECRQSPVSYRIGMKWFTPTDPIELDPEGPLPCFEFQSPRTAVERGIQCGKQVAKIFAINLGVGLRHDSAPVGQGRMQGKVEHFVAPAQQATPQDVSIPGRVSRDEQL
jgi:hypothetical protein